MKLYYVPVSTYCQKVLMAFEEKGVDFEGEIVNLSDEAARAEYLKLYPIGKVPLLIPDDDGFIPESSIIIEYLDTHFASGTKLIPDDPDLARQARFKDRMTDLYLNDSISALFFQGRKAEGDRDPALIERSQYRARVLYEFMEKNFESREWANGDQFSMADCAAAPPLFYAQTLFPFDDYPNVKSYYERLSARPSWQKVMDEAMPYIEEMKQAS